VIDDRFLDDAFEALRNNNNKKKFEPLIAKAYNDLAGLSELENFIKREYRDTVAEIKDFILKWLKDEDISQYLEVNKNIKEQILELKKKTGSAFFFFLNPKLEDIISLNYEKEILRIAGLIPAFKIITAKVAAGFGTATIASLGGILATTFDIDDSDILDGFSDITDGQIRDEIGHQIAAELIEYIGAAIPFIGFAFIILKLIRVFGIFKMFIDRPEKLKEMREKVVTQLSQFLDYICDKSTFEVEHSSFQLVSDLKDRFIDIQNKAMSQMKNI
jgi:hypothetical protein